MSCYRRKHELRSGSSLAGVAGFSETEAASKAMRGDQHWLICVQLTR